MTAATRQFEPGSAGWDCANLDVPPTPLGSAEGKLLLLRADVTTLDANITGSFSSIEVIQV